MELIETIEVGAGGASALTFQNIPQDGTDLVCVISGRSDHGNIVSGIRVNFNSDTGANYSGVELFGNGSSASSGTGTTNYIQATFGATDSLATANTFGSQSVYISNYTASQNKSVSVDAVTENNATFSYQNISAWSWADTTAISSMQITLNLGNYVEGSTASLYKVTAEDNADFPLAGTPKATGGSINYSSGYWYHTFRSSDTFTPSENLDIEYLVVAGGGGGGGRGDELGPDGGGGGGAGGLTSGTASVTASPISIVVGAGGAENGNGTDSVFTGIATMTGGADGGDGSEGGNNGGSGGGGGATTDSGGNQLTFAGGPGVSGQGFDGQDGFVISFKPYGGRGGGAGEAGGSGGDGLQFLDFSTGASINYDNGYFAGGGGGGRGDTSGVTAGGLGGSGTGSSRRDGTDATAGQPNSGSGGGGGSGFATDPRHVGKPGGSGVVIVRYAA